MSVLTLLVATFRDTRPAEAFFRINSGETRTIAWSSGVQQRDPIGSAIFSLALRPGLERFMEEFEREGVEAFACMDGISVGLRSHGQHDYINCLPPRELDDMSTVVDATNTVALQQWFLRKACLIMRVPYLMPGKSLGTAGIC